MKQEVLEYVWVGFDYDQLSKLIERVKLGGEFALVRFLAEFLELRVRESLKSKELILPDYISFSPGDPERIKKRGFNLAQKLAQKLGGSLKIPVLPIVRKQKSFLAQGKLKNLTD